MTKQDAPPPYPAVPPPQTSQTEYISWYLAHLAPQIRHSRQRDQSYRDGTIISLLIDHITNFLHNFATRSTEEKAEMVLVPAAAAEGWSFVRPTGPGKGQVGGLVKVVVDKESAQKLRPGEQGGDQDGEPPRAGDPGGSSEWQRNEFDDWGRWDSDPETGPDPVEYLWWSDEDLAKRLARLLQPSQPRPALPPPVPRELTRPSSKWDFFKSPDPLEPRGNTRGGAYGGTGGGMGGIGVNMGVGMSVKAEEVTFRRENDMGIWESRSGFALVVRVWSG